MFRPLPCVLSLAAATVVTTVAAASLSSATVKRLSVGTTTVVAGDGFARPVQAWLELGRNRIPLRVARGATSTQFEARLASVPRGAHGPCDLHVRAAGSRVPFTLAGFTVELPATASAAPLRASPGDELTVDGSYFGAKRGRVVVGTKAARVVSWADDRIVVRLHPRTAGGPTFVEVSNQAGASVERPVITVE